jgi:transposase
MSGWVFRRAALARQKKRRQRIAEFAELLSEGLTLEQIWQHMGIGKSTATEYLRQIKADLGPQAD